MRWGIYVRWDFRLKTYLRNTFIRRQPKYCWSEASAIYTKKGVGVTTMERVPTGIAELDSKLSGGYPKGKTVLITGASGAGKIIFGLQFIHRSCADGLKCVHIATEESPEDLLVQAEMLGLNLEPYLDCEQLVIKRVLETRTQNVEQAEQLMSEFDTTGMNLSEVPEQIPGAVEHRFTTTRINLLGPVNWCRTIPMWWSSITWGCSH
uniref:Circadian clock protein kinase KaiC n=1 Tax=Candidatus Methanogaster sp. ANME-2c ERB4 TaxID=2759911 RepID=A0A7G9YIG1_9EURY|nr:circadian clock protein kinase KaiC [Methanosarcinales archaeon ANME-2c ERB4]QNO47795.1 circadian clock protein kinase KaiC [Methanosarcinales archaeon ANME-2c ERB4]